MNLSEYEYLMQREKAYFWNVGRREILRAALLRNLDKKKDLDIIDIGCGTGGNMLLLNDFGKVSGLDFSEEALKFASKNNFESLTLGDATKLLFENESFDLATALDVLEHIPNDILAIQEAFRVLKSGGLFLITVPSYPWLWSQHDKVLHHVRRYYKNDLVKKLTQAGFLIEESSHFVMLAVFVNSIRKIKDKIFGSAKQGSHSYDIVFGGIINYILLSVLRLEKFIMRFIGVPFGTSLLIVAKKPASSALDAVVEYVSCDLCASKEQGIIYENKFTLADFSRNRTASFAYASPDSSRGAIVRCNSCNLVYMNPRDKDISALYEGVEDSYYFSSREDRHISFERDLKELHSVLGLKFGQNKKLLDIGCSYGFFMDVAKKFGWDVYGCELSKKQSAYAFSNHKNVCNKMISECNFKENYFDVIVLYDVLEHVASPLNFIRECTSFLRKGGAIVITTPDYSSLSAKLMGRFWINFARMHLYYFTPSTIKNLFDKSGLEIIKSVRHKRVARLGVIIKWLSKFPVLYSVANIFFGNKLLSNIRFTSSLSGNMTVYARKK